jgi:excisionase family DNA binding protein
VREVAESLGVDPRTVEAWIERGWLNASWSADGYRIRRKAVRRMLVDVPEVSNVVARAQLRKESQ